MQSLHGMNALGATVELDGKSVKDLAFQLKAEHAPFFGVIGSNHGGKVTLTVAISDDVVASKGLHAGNLVRQLAAHIDGGGGGQASYATAGGSNRDGLAQAISEALQSLK
jgi:alanyl-tRNA synthetase